MVKHPRLKFWLKVAGGVLIAFFAALSIVLPIIVKAKVTDWLKQHGGQQTVMVERVVFNPLLLRLTIHAFFLGKPGQKMIHRQNASISIGLLHLWEGRLMINNFNLYDAVVLIEHTKSDEWSVGGIRFKSGQSTTNKGPEKKKKQTLQIGLRDIDIANVKIGYEGPEFDQHVVVDSARLDEFESWRSDRSSHFFLRASLAGGTLSFKGEIIPQGKQRRLVSTKIAADSVAVGWLSKLFRLSGIESFDGTLNMALKIRGTTGSQILHVPDSAAVLGGEGTLSLSRVNARLVSPPYIAALQNVTYSGRFAIEPSPLRIDGDLTISSPVIHTDDSETVLARASALNATGIALTGVSKMSVASVRIDNVAAAESEFFPDSIGSSPYVLTLRRILLNGMAMENGNQFHINSAKIEKADVTVMLDTSGDLVFPAIPPAKPFSGTFAIDTFRLDTTSSLLFIDRSVLPETYVPLSAFGVTIFDFKSSHLSKPCSIFLRGNIGPYSPLRLQGQITSLDSGGSGYASIRLDQLSLPLFSGYMVKHYGCRVKSGSLSMAFNGTVNRGELKAVDTLHFRALDIHPVSKSRANSAFKLPLLGSMSLTSLLNIISRHNGDLDMTIKISGDLKHPNFNIFSEVLKKSITNGIVGVVRRILSAIGRFLLWPFRLNLHFKPVEFVSGSDSLSPSNKEYLDSLVVKIKAHERVRFHLCGKATSEDLQVITRAYKGKKPPPSDSISDNDKQLLFHLALSRAFAVKRYLADVKGVNPEQLFLCDPELDLSGHAKPRVEFST